MRTAVLSGKGGTGKTFLSVNLAAAAGRSVYIDCDVEEPNGRIFLKPEAVRSSVVTTPLPEFAPELCDGCRKCVDFCRFHALVFLKGTPRVFPDVCHACGGCGLVCPRQAVSWKERPIGVVEEGRKGGVRVVTGILNTGEASAVGVIRAALAACRQDDCPVIIDCPPGSSCSVMESVSQADYCLLSAEPTAFGFDNFRMVHQLVQLLGKPCGVVINKAGVPYQPLEEYCIREKLSILARIPYQPHLASLTAEGRLAVEEDPAVREIFEDLLGKLSKEERK